MGRALKDFVPSRDSVRSANCSGFMGCMAVYSDMGYCSNAWGVNMSDCVDGGTPIDNVVNVETSILDKIVKGILGVRIPWIFSIQDDNDTNVTFPAPKRIRLILGLAPLSVRFSVRIVRPRFCVKSIA